MRLKLTKVREAVNKRLGGILSEPLYCVATMLDARYKDRYFEAAKKQGLRGMLDTAGQDGNSHSDRAHRRRGHGQTELKLHCLTCMMKSWLRLNKLTMKQHSERNRF